MKKFLILFVGLLVLLGFPKDTLAANQFSNPNFDSNLSGWPTGDGNWWESGGATGAVAAYQPKGAASLAASYSNLANPGTYDASAGTAPSWDSVGGWTFASASLQYLKTGVIPTSQDWSYLIQFSNASQGPGGGNSSLFGFLNTVGGVLILRLRPIGVTGVGYTNGGSPADVSPTLAGGNLAIVGPKGYRNGVDEGITITNWTAGTTPLEIYIGTVNQTGAMSGVRLINAKVQAMAIYSTTLNSSSVASVAASMAVLGSTSYQNTTSTYGGSSGSAKAVASWGRYFFTQNVNVGNTNQYNLSVYAYTDGSALSLADAILTYNGQAVTTTYVPASGGWYRLYGTITGVNSSVPAGVLIQSGKTVYLDNMELYCNDCPQTSTDSTTTSNSNQPNGFTLPITSGPHFQGTNTFQDTPCAKAYIPNNASVNDLNLTVSQTPAFNPVPWSQGLNTVSEIFNFQTVSASKLNILPWSIQAFKLQNQQLKGKCFQ